jgi:hypothetical protein
MVVRCHAAAVHGGGSFWRQPKMAEAVCVHVIFERNEVEPILQATVQVVENQIAVQ